MTGIHIMRLAAALAFALALFGAAAGCALWLAQRPWFDIHAIVVQGDLRHVSAAAVRAAIAGQLRGTWFTMRLSEARRAFESVPWVAGASVRRVWPHALEVTLVEHRAVAVHDDGRLVSDAGVLFAANPEEAEIYAPLVGVGGPEDSAREAVERLRECGELLAPLGLAIARVEASERRSWAIETADGARFELGRDEPPGRIRTRLAAVVTAWPIVVAQLHAAPTRIDLRYPNGFAAAAPGVAEALAAVTATPARRRP